MQKQEWNSFSEARPYVTVSGFAIDNNGRFPLLHRSEKVRSARNAWSLPSGLHEVGITGSEQFSTELKEELNLEPINNACQFIGFYENIRPDGPDLPGWHWWIAVYVQKVVTLDTLLNKEPDKHDLIDVVNFHDTWIEGRAWAPKLGEFLSENFANIFHAIESVRRV